MVMTAQQRSDAARKACATRKANRAAGIGPTPKATGGTFRPRKGKLFAAPVVDARGLLLVALASMEDAMVQKLREAGITDAARNSFAKYKKLKALALGPTSSSAAQNEAYAALRMSLIEAIKLTF